MTMITPSYLGETIEYSSLHACRSTLEDPTRTRRSPVGSEDDALNGGGRPSHARVARQGVHQQRTIARRRHRVRTVDQRNRLSLLRCGLHRWRGLAADVDSVDQGARRAEQRRSYRERLRRWRFEQDPHQVTVSSSGRHRQLPAGSGAGMYYPPRAMQVTRRFRTLVVLAVALALFSTGCNRLRRWRHGRHGGGSVGVFTERRPVTDRYYDVTVTDDYRWLENASDPDVRAWTDMQNQHTRAALDPLPGRQALEQRLTQILNAQSASFPEVRFRGGTLFALRTRPGTQQPILVSYASTDHLDSERVVVDPNAIDTTGQTEVEFYTPSHDARYVAVSLASNGSEQGTLHVFAVATGQQLPDSIAGVSFPTGGGSFEWNADNTGIYYTRYPRAGERPEADRPFYQQVYLHLLGHPESEDTYQVGRDFPRIAETVLHASPDKQWLLATVANGDGGQFAHYLLGPSGTWTQLTHNEDEITGAVLGPDSAIYLLSHHEAPRGKILRLALDPQTPPALSAATMIVPESEGVIEHVVPTATRLYVADLLGGPSRIRVFDHQGQSLGNVAVPDISSVKQIVYTTGDEVLFRSETFLTPPAWLRASPELPAPAPTALRDDAPINYDDCEVEQEFGTSHDGTHVPIMIVRRRGTVLNGQNPTLLTGYGGYGVSMVPSFSLSNRVWIDRGGVIALAILRGGGEYGESWHRAGNLTNKQHVFDDFIAAAEHMIEAQYTSPQHLAIRGRSNGGLLMGAVLTQRPELFRAVYSGVGIYDMLRVELDANGEFNVTEFGSVRDPDQFRALYAYSPYHHVDENRHYPAILLTTGEHDGRVNPAHSRKMAARLQAVSDGSRPVLLRVSAHAGHGMGSSRREVIAEATDVWSFLFHELGMDQPAPSPAN